MMEHVDWCLLVAEKEAGIGVKVAVVEILEGDEGHTFDSIEALETAINNVDLSVCVPFAFKRTTSLTPLSVKYENIKTVSVKSVAKVVTK